MKSLLEAAALILSLINGLMLLKYYLTDKPRLQVRPVHPDIYQWWFRLPDGKYKDLPIRKYGFLVYVGISNKGLRKVSLASWRLFINTTMKKVELKPISIPEPKAELSGSGHVKTWPVLGQQGISFKGNTLIDSGTSIAGMAYYVAEFYESELWNPVIRDGKVIGDFVITDAFGNSSRTKIIFRGDSIEKVKTLIENIELIH
jgi:hypothetical protein